MEKWGKWGDVAKSVSMIGAALLGIIAYFISTEQIKSTIPRLENSSAQHDSIIMRHETKIAVTEAKMDELSKKINAMDGKLDTILISLSKGAK